MKIHREENMKNKNLVYKYDNAARVNEAIEYLEKEHWNDISDLAYMQVPTEETIFREMTHQEMMKLIHEGHFNPKKGILRRNPKRRIHVISLKVKKLEKLDEISKILWSSGGCESSKNSGWYRSKTKRVYQIIVNRSELKRTMKRMVRTDEISPVEGFGA